MRIGRAIKTIFVCRYFRLKSFRREIQQGLNVGHNFLLILLLRRGYIKSNTILNRGANLGDSVELWGCKNLKLISTGLVALALLGCADGSNKDESDLHPELTSNEKYSAERKYNSTLIARNHCKTHDVVLVGLGETALALSCDFQGSWRKPHAGNSYYPVNYDSSKEMVPDANGNMVIPLIGLGTSGNKIKIMREQYDQNIPLGIVGMIIIPSVDDPVSQGRIGSRCSRIVNYACRLTWRMPDEKLIIKLDIFLNELDENGAIKTPHVSLSGREQVLYPRETWPKLQTDVNAYIKSLIINSNQD